ncbi:conserved hypothetical protein [Ricinus communis]|uniref:Uncharacterized protein n=1 Tax=Ricinus communis TaxID=3988 RepID=B9RL78_RICCO|nr:conserved hypothetical protein [Ricinus communis]
MEITLFCLIRPKYLTALEAEGALVANLEGGLGLDTFAFGREGVTTSLLDVFKSHRSSSILQFFLGREIGDKP